MRKPLVVVCVTASAVLLAGGIAATAGADTGADRPEVPGIALPGMPAAGQDADGDAGPDGGDRQFDFDLPALVAQAQDQAGQDQAGQDQAGQDQAAQNQAADGQADRDQGAAERPQGQLPAQDQRPAMDQEPVRQPQQDREQPQQDREQPHQDREPQQTRQRPAGGGNQNVSPASVSSSVDAPVQRQVLSLVNQNRRRGGCDNLTLDRRLIVAANRHAADMARRGYFAHRSPNGERAGERVRDAGYEWSRYGENIARGQDTAYEVVDGWMHSPEHRENIMDCRLHEMGIGLAFDDERTPYWVQNFATPER